MSFEELAGPLDPAGESNPPLVEPVRHRDRPIALSDPDAYELRARVAELDAIAWNLPSRRADLLLPPDAAWPGDAL